MNILTFDVEEWFLDKEFFGQASWKNEKYDFFLDSILDNLEKTNTKATFFCLGKLATDFPHVVKKISERGHEIGCHSNRHTWLNTLNQEQVYNDTSEAIDKLEQCIGSKVESYRAPAFSIGPDNLYVFEILNELGIKRDSSIFPASRDFGGFKDFNVSIPFIMDVNGHAIKEFPICTTSFMGRQTAYTGGGYFRFFPLRYIVKKMLESDYSISYFHLNDFVHGEDPLMSKDEFERYFKQPGSIVNRYKRYIKANLFKKNAFAKYVRLMNKVAFVNLIEVDELIDWDNAPVINY